MTHEEEDVRKMVRLLGETAALKGGHAAKKTFLLDSLCQLVNIDAWVWFLGCQIAPGEQQVYAGWLHRGFTDERYVKVLSAVEHPIMGSVVEPFFRELKETGRHITRTRNQLDPNKLAMQDGIRELWEAADIKSFILSYFPLSNNSMSCVALYRNLDAAEFTERERERERSITHIILDEVPWLHESGWPEDHGASVPRMYPRQRMAMNLLLEGKDRKTIASQMEISENTVSGYIKDVYRHFSVNSHVELMHKFLYAEVS